MRNMKRVLSLVLAMVMLLGMLTIPTGAASNFADADQIVNTEAVDITAGMGLFAGSDGKFNPQGTVTRAQMATIIVKMMYGSDFNADSFKGAGNPFPDTAAFEGGWAEGYINACFQMGVVKGYGDGSFKPGKQVTTAEAVTMIINALKIDAGEGEWPNTVMAKATELKLFGDLKPAPATNNVLVRDQLAVIVLEGLQCSPSGSNTYSYTTPGGKTFEFDSLEDAMSTVGVENADSITVNPAEDTLAKKVYNLKIETGFITDNKATGADYTVVNGVDFDVETGLDMIGHYVSVYYQVPKSGQSVDANKVYSVVDDSVVVTVDEDAVNAKEYKAAFSKNYEPAESVKVFESDYSISEATNITGSYTAGSKADAGTYIISENKVIAYLKPAAKYATYIASISEFDGEKTYMLGGMMETISQDSITTYLGAAKDDVVIYVKAKDQYVLEPVDPVKGVVTKITGNSEDGYVMTLNGQGYELFEGAGNHADGAELTIVMDADRFSYGEQYTVYLTQDNKVVGWKLASGGIAGEVDASKIVYALGAYTATEKDDYGVKTTKHLLQAVNAEGNEVQILLAQGENENMQGNFTGSDASYVKGFYVVEDYDGTDKDAKKAGIKLVTPIGLRSQAGTEVGNGLTYADNLFYGANRWGGSTITMPGSNVNSHICTTDCTMLAGGAGPEGARYHKYSDTTENDKNTYRTFFNDDTKFLIVKGEFGEPLKCAAGGDDFTYTLTGSGTFTLPMLFTEDDSGLLDVVMVVIPKDPNDLAASYPTIYVTGEVIGSTAEGDLIEGYLAKEATPTDVLVRPGTEVTKGFKAYTVDDNGWFQMTDSTSDSVFSDMVIRAITSAGLLNAFDPNYNAETATAKMQTPSGANATKAKILDLRSEQNVQDSGVGTLTTLEQLRTLLDNGYVINADIYGSKTTANAIYVTGTYKNSRDQLYVTAPSKAGVPTLAYSVKTGKVEYVTVKDHSDVVGFATVVEDRYTSSLVASEGDNYYLNEVVTGEMTMSGDNVIITSRNGLTVTVTPDTVIAKSDAAITSPATLKAAYDALPGSESYTYSYSLGENGEATFFVIVDKGDPDVGNGDLVKTTAVLAATTEGNVVEDAWKVTGNLAGEKHAVSYAAVDYPEGVDPAELASTGEYYYVVSKDDRGQVTLTFQYNFVVAGSDKIFVPGTVKGGEVVEAYAMNRAGVDPTEIVLVAIPEDAKSYGSTAASGASNTTGGRFWSLRNGVLSGQQGAYAYDSNVYTYHDTIVSWDGTTLVTDHATGHTGTNSNCGYKFNYACGTLDPSVGRRKEAAGTLTVPADVSIIDLTGNNCQTVDAIKTLTDAGNAVINLFVPNGTASSGTVSVIFVLDPKLNFEPNNMVRVEPAVGGEVSVDPAFGIAGTTVTVTATAGANYVLSSIVVDGQAIEGNTFTITGNHTVSAVFVEKPKFAVSVTPAANGEVTLSEQGQVYRDTVITVTAAPTDGYALKEILVNGSAIEGNTFVVTADAVVTATFEEDRTPYAVTVVQPADESGVVAVDVSSGVPGTDVVVTATPAAGYVLQAILVDGEAIEGNTFKIEKNGNTVTATFAKLYSVTPAADCEYGSVEVDKTSVVAGETVTVTADADTGFKLHQIFVNGEAIEGTSFTAVAENMAVTALFVYELKDNDVLYTAEVTEKDAVKLAVIAYSGAGVPSGSVVPYVCPAGTGVANTSFKINLVVDGALKPVQTVYKSNGTTQKVAWKFALHEAVKAVDTANKKFTIGNFTTDIHSNGSAKCPWNKGYSPSYTGNGYMSSSSGVSSPGCERTNGAECAETQNYNDATAVIDMREFFITNDADDIATMTMAQLAALDENSMVDVYVPDAAEGTSGTASLIVVLPVAP